MHTYTPTPKRGARSVPKGRLALMAATAVAATLSGCALQDPQDLLLPRRNRLSGWAVLYFSTLKIPLIWPKNIAGSVTAPPIAPKPKLKIPRTSSR